VPAAESAGDEAGPEEVLAFVYAPILEGEKTRYFFVQGELAYFGLVRPADAPEAALRTDLL
jgi:hypothetical protein